MTRTELCVVFCRDDFHVFRGDRQFFLGGPTSGGRMVFVRRYLKRWCEILKKCCAKGHKLHPTAKVVKSRCLIPPGGRMARRYKEGHTQNERTKLAHILSRREIFGFLFVLYIISAKSPRVEALDASEKSKLMSQVRRSTCSFKKSLDPSSREESSAYLEHELDIIKKNAT